MWLTGLRFGFGSEWFRDTLSLDYSIPWPGLLETPLFFAELIMGLGGVLLMVI